MKTCNFEHSRLCKMPIFCSNKYSFEFKSNVELESERTTNKKRKSDTEIKNEAPRKMLKFNEIETDLKHRYSNYVGER
jgi:hypothetical protein